MKEKVHIELEPDPVDWVFVKLEKCKRCGSPLYQVIREVPASTPMPLFMVTLAKAGEKICYKKDTTIIQSIVCYWCRKEIKWV